ncbi:MAG: hypothetical protein EX330_00875 [Candidatus Brocadia sp. BROELEC01]|nr:hypothetical protein [Candidatus Brocadia sapporoensis]QQR65735.1 MAG: hypothetical protein IPI25_09175 [Candidatus Brocadia sp.]RZV59762.1 MAG: hypothetical protein EX330_00875 [Candidatus Brocadia sp. BROELEC01]
MWIPCEKTKADDANNCAMNKHSRFAGCLQKIVCDIILMIVEYLTPWSAQSTPCTPASGGHVGCTILTRVSWCVLIS